MPTFHVRETFEIPSRQLFVMAGAILDGQIQAGMFVHVKLNSSLDLTIRIHSMDLVTRHGREDVCLCISAEPDVANILRGLNIADESFEVTTEGSD